MRRIARTLQHGSNALGRPQRTRRPDKLGAQLINAAHSLLLLGAGLDGAAGALDGALDAPASPDAALLPEELGSTFVVEPGLGRWSFLPSLP